MDTPPGWSARGDLGPVGDARAAGAAGDARAAGGHGAGERGAGDASVGDPSVSERLAGRAGAAARYAGRLAKRGASATGRAASATGRVGAAAGRTGIRGTVAGARFVGKGTKAGSDRFRDFAESEGAAETGLARVTEMQVLASAGDAAFAVSLASTVLAMPVGQARGQVAIFLLTTMAPFVLLAPFIGPILDRYRHGRRWAIGTTLAVRAFLSWVLAGLVADGSPWVLPVALGALIATRAYAVSLSAGIPLVRPEAVTLVRANSRQSIATLLGMTLGGLVAAPVGRLGAGWSLRLAFVVYVAATVAAIRLPASVDSPAVEAATAGPRSSWRESLRGSWRLAAQGLSAQVRAALVTASGAKALSGFVTFYLAFLLQEQPLPGLASLVELGLVVAAAGLGNALGSFAGNRFGARSPTVIASAMLIAAIAVSLLTTLVYAVWSVLLLALVAGAFGQLAKLCLDALIQADADPERAARTFAWSETRLQTAWVIGGGVGIVLPLLPAVGFGLLTAGLVGVLVAAVRVRRAPAPDEGLDADSPG